MKLNRNLNMFPASYSSAANDDGTSVTVTSESKGLIKTPN